MPAATEEIATIWTGGGPHGRPPGRGGGGRGDGGRGDGDPFDRHRQVARTGIWVALAPILMLFAAFTSAYIVRRGLSNDWQPLALPAILWLNTALLVAGSFSIEQARGCFNRGLAAGFNRWWSLTTVLGAAFLAGQLLAWWQLRQRGVYLASNPSSSFFYLLTAMHAMHMAGGIAALMYVSFQTLRQGLGPARRAALEVSAIYWHFLGGLWVFLFLLLLFWR